MIEIVTDEKGLDYFSIKNMRKLQNIFKKEGFHLIDLSQKSNKFKKEKLTKGVVKNEKTIEIINAFISFGESGEITESNEDKFKRMLVAEGLTLQDANKLIRIKTYYHEERIRQLILQQATCFSLEREQTLSQLRQKPAIEFATKAYVKDCVATYNEYKANYAFRLREAEQMERDGLISRKEVSEIVRNNCYKDMQCEEE